MNQTALNNKLKELLVLNGNQPLTPERPRPDTTPDAQTLGLTEYPAVPLPADFPPAGRRTAGFRPHPAILAG